ncbi:type IX secretion system membrane protein PorP/SprF [Cryomorphaceae bacterium 1068]|nr:type IX secretion system membrane protein PorP/SprF [Cryomorphaceae bacterium 1068]
MMKGHLQTYGAMLLMLIGVEMSAQDMQFSQPYSNPLYLNPAFAGSIQATRVVMNYRKQWPGIENEYNALAAGVDMYIDDINAGVGVSVMKDVAGANNLSNTVASVYYSQQIAISRKSNLAVGVKGSFGQRAFGDGNFLFADQIIRESATSLSQPNLNLSRAYADFAAGILYFNTKSWLGVSLHRINEPNQSLLGGSDIIPRKLSIHGGSIIPIESFEESLGQKKLRVAFNYKQQGEWNQLDLGAYFTISHVNFGMWYRGLPMKPYKPGYQNNESLIFLVGYEAPKRFTFGYSYDISINRLFGYSGGAHEISMILEVHNRKKKKKRRIVPCARF